MSGWTAKKENELRRRWTAGETGFAIAAAMRVTRNAVIGKAHRLGLPPRPSPIKPRAPGAAPSRPPLVRERAAVAKSATAGIAPTPPEPPPPPPPPMAIAPRLAVAKTSRTAARPCCWPIGEPGAKNFRFCDGPAAPRSPYCSEHHARAFVAVRPRRGTAVGEAAAA